MSFGLPEISKNILLDKTCDTCSRQQSDDSCVRWLGESFGWQWLPKAEENTCEDWKK